ncbi:hypothetical protein A2917_03470 [Candidatus Nomurabacteria bacterium RIFCSPLOWO2_01_FULL_42_17]|uniref:Uncharacterized protein n=1 Tax=Candidatus Nomurabacteria bacterium RIFCSPLOWO2_01_FULL_42_17 TaxID=1801780 RepID=A0A1F6XN79_9BACT|nr:MAG: hypothetical protein A2917_03470 [Candidatus Nomurabacteria bacterium RIFCSPLOWO2_01_FULL_42_17]
MKKVQVFNSREMIHARRLKRNAVYRKKHNGSARLDQTSLALQPELTPPSAVRLDRKPEPAEQPPSHSLQAWRKWTDEELEKAAATINGQNGGKKDKKARWLNYR